MVYELLRASLLRCLLAGKATRVVLALSLSSIEGFFKLIVFPLALSGLSRVRASACVAESNKHSRQRKLGGEKTRYMVSYARPRSQRAAVLRQRDAALSQDYGNINSHATEAHQSIDEATLAIRPFAITL